MKMWASENGRTCVVGFVHSSCSSEASRRCSGLNKHVNFGVCLFLTGVRVVPEPSDTSTTIGRTCVCGFGHYAYPCEKQAEPEVNMLVKTRTPSRSLGRARTVHELNHTSTTSEVFCHFLLSG